jgi:hypothetical protein
VIHDTRASTHPTGAQAVHPDYLILRLIRHFLPTSLAHFLLKKGWIIRPGMETRSPEAALERYCRAIEAYGASLAGKRALVFGYGGNFALGCMLLEAGARQVILSDKYARPVDELNASLLPRYASYLRLDGGRVFADGEQLLLEEGDIRQSRLAPVEIVLSSSVYEHLDDVPGITRALAGITAADGLHVHFIDLRDHYFKYPFEMLSYSEQTWQRWLNPTSNLNRWRCSDYRRVFEGYFTRVQINILEQDAQAYARALPRIRAEFLAEAEPERAATIIQVMASTPRRERVI